eukprot:TRINITY_DN8044_c0_g1_i1.p1 TRINITY_DN8044_c0_g1~~TRINITY_DN8044_c0_g1_i1.p1  ORF type:complete len:256 (-),score=43.54 TRINITY_DN8044_c0_g1_i1:55-822(-)
MWQKQEARSLEERRKTYRCGADFVKPEDIVRWSSYQSSNEQSKETGKPQFHDVNEKLNSKIALWRGDIATLEVDAVVSSAKTSLLGGCSPHSVDGAIHTAAGQKLEDECYLHNGCSVGEAKLTRGYNLPAKYVIHAVGPIGEREDTLQSCYRRCLEIGKENNFKTLAFCSISTGSNGYPLYSAVHVALSTVREWLEAGDNQDVFELIIFCMYNDKEVGAYESLTPTYFPLQSSSSSSTALTEEAGGEEAETEKSN